MKNIKARFDLNDYEVQVRLIRQIFDTC